jgi:hypothetical protein
MASDRRSSKRLRGAAVVCALTSWAWLVVTLPTFSDAGVEVLFGGLLICGSAVIGVAEAVVVGVALARRPVPARGFLVAGATAVVLTQGCWITDWDFRCRLWLSDASLRRYAEDFHQRETSGDGRDTGGEAGLFSFLWVSGYGDGSVEFVTGYGFKDPHGFYHVPPGARVPPFGHHVYGPWYKFGQE